MSRSHVYGGPVARATMEELAYYGVRHVLAYGLAGGLSQRRCPLGTFYVVEDAFAADGTTRHYTDAPIVAASPVLLRQVARLRSRRRRRPRDRPREAQISELISLAWSPERKALHAPYEAAPVRSSNPSHEGTLARGVELLAEQKTGAFLDQALNHVRAGRLARAAASTASPPTTGASRCRWRRVAWRLRRGIYRPRP